MGRRSDGAPQWPSGYVGSITHTRSFASAAVARSAVRRGIGIDSEELMDERTLGEVAPMVLDEGERRWIQGPSRLERATLIFSAKESLYKCIGPLAGVFFDFASARIDVIDDARGTFQVRLLAALPGFARGSTFPGRFAVQAGMVHTTIELES